MILNMYVQGSLTSRPLPVWRILDSTRVFEIASGLSLGECYRHPTFQLGGEHFGAKLAHPC